MLEAMQQSDQTYKTELYTLWKSQEDLLQQYRRTAITILSFMATFLFVAFRYITENSNKPDYHSPLTYLLGSAAEPGKPNIYSPIGPHIYELYIFLINILLVLLVLYISFISIFHFRRIVVVRAQNVSFLQNLIILAEDNILTAELTAAGHGSNIKLYSLLRAYHLYRADGPVGYTGIDLSPELCDFYSKHSKPQRSNDSARYILTSWIFNVFLGIFYLFGWYIFLYIMYIISL